MRIIKLFLMLPLAVCSMPWIASSAETWKQVLDRADSLSSAHNQDSALTIAGIALQMTLAEFGGNDSNTAMVMNQLALFNYSKANFERADTLYRQALSIRESVLGLDHLEVAASLNGLGNLRMRQGRYADAESLYLRALTIREKSLGANHLDVAAIAENLGIAISAQGRYAEAEPLYKRALLIREKVLKPDHPDVATSLNNLGLLYQNQGRFEEAVPLYEQALAIREKAFGPDHPEVATSLDNLANSYTQQGRFSESEPLYKRALAIREKVLGPDHPDVASSCNNLGILCWNEGRYAEAEAFYKRNIAIREKALGPNHPDLVGALANLGGLYWYQDRAEEAEPLFKRALEISEKNLGPDHPDVAFALGNLGILYWSQGRYAEAEPLYKRAISIREKTLKSNHPDLAASYLNLAVLCMDQGRYVEAEPCYKKALAMFEASVGPDHPSVGSCLNGLGNLYATVGRYAEAEPLIRKALAIKEKSLGPDHPGVAGCLRDLGVLFMDQGRYADAESLCRRALAIKEKAFGTAHGDIAGGMDDLAIIASKQGNYEVAESLFTRALEVAQNALGPNHLIIADYRENYSKFCRLVGRGEEAKTEAGIAFGLRLTNFRDNSFVLSEKDALAFSAALRQSADNYLSCQLESGSAVKTGNDGACDVILAIKGLVSDAAILRRKSLITEKDTVLLALADSLRLARLQISKLYASGPGDDTTAAYKMELESLSRNANELEAELYRESASFQRHQDLNNMSISRVAAALPEGASLVEFLRWNNLQVKPDTLIPCYLALIVDKNKEPEIVNLGDASAIEPLVSRYLKHMERVAAAGRLPNAADMAAYQPINQALYEKIWQPLERHFQKNQMIFVGLDGSLNLVSLASMRDKEGKYLTEKYVLHNLSSGRDLIRLRDKAETGHGLFAIGDPDFDASIGARLKDFGEPVFASVTKGEEYQTRNVRSGCGSLSDFKVESLPYTRNEVMAIKHLWLGKGSDSARIFVGAYATEDVFKAQAPGSRVLHLATHGYYLTGQCAPSIATRHSFSLGEDFVGENPFLQSGLLLAGANLHGAGCDSAHCEDGILSASEVSGMDLTGTDLVVLSACETGLGEVKAGEGVYGLRRAFQMAGARTVISSLWPVPDEATADVMSQLYEQSKISIPERLRELQLAQIGKLRASGVPDHPYSWAAFIALGDWR